MILGIRIVHNFPTWMQDKYGKVPSIMHNASMNFLQWWRPPSRIMTGLFIIGCELGVYKKISAIKTIFRYISKIPSHKFLLMIWWRFTIIKVESGTTAAFLWLLATNYTPQALNGWITFCLTLSQTFVLSWEHLIAMIEAMIISMKAQHGTIMMMCYRTMLPRVGQKRLFRNLVAVKCYRDIGLSTVSLKICALWRISIHSIFFSIKGKL